MQTLLVAFMVAFTVTLLIVRLRHRHVGLSGDSPVGVQKFHVGAVPRVGGGACCWDWGLHWRGVHGAAWWAPRPPGCCWPRCPPSALGWRRI